MFAVSVHSCALERIEFVEPKEALGYGRRREGERRVKERKAMHENIYR